MVSTFRHQIRLMRFLGRFKIAEPMRFTAYGDTSAPFVLEKYHANKTGFVPSIRLADILRVSGGVYHTKIAQTVIVLVAIYMVNKAVRPVSVSKKPRKSVRFVYSTFIAYCDIWCRKIACFIASFDRARRTGEPHQIARFGVVMKDGAKMFSGYVSHGVNIYPKIIKGQV